MIGPLDVSKCRWAVAGERSIPRSFEALIAFPSLLW